MNDSLVASNFIIDGSTATFEADVLTASMQTPILVDFWAPWCGPCKQLTPALEQVINELNGQIKLVKINLDENQQLATQMGVKSVPTIIAFVNGKPVDGFMGALPVSQIMEFANKIIALTPGGAKAADFAKQLEQALKQAQTAIEENKLADAEHIYSSILEQVPDNNEALIGLANTYILAQVYDKAQEELDRVSEEGQKSQEFLAIKAKLQLANEASTLGEQEELEAKLQKNPNDNQTRYDLAIILNSKDERVKAAQILIEIMQNDREFNDDGARKKLLEFFESWGTTDEATIKGRRLLSSALFS
jgi:putative thioredoxin